MENFEKNENIPETEVNTEENTAYVNEEPETADFYDKNIPGPTKYDRAEKTYEDALKRESKVGSSDKEFPAVLALIFGIVAIILSFVPIVGTIFGTGAAVAGIVLGAISLKGSKRGFSVTAIVLSVIALVLIILITLLFIMLIIEGISNFTGSYRGHYYRPFLY